LELKIADQFSSSHQTSIMTKDEVIPTEHELDGLDLNDPRTLELIQRAQDADAADKQLTIRQALKKYKKAVFWAAILSFSLVMEGYDLVMVRLHAQVCSSYANR
jgi:SP family general alpha glucoside:H+ symporter-like MFS transporter